MANAIEANGLRKRFGRATALDGLDLTVRDGEVHAFLGPNGAGKTTTIRILLGLLRRDGGEVSLLGGDPWRDATTLHSRLAYVPGDVTLWPGLTGGEIIDLLARLRGGKHDPKRRQELIERFDLDPSKKARAYSKGNRQKVALIAALASDAELLILDEPTSGLDPLMEATFRTLSATSTAKGAPCCCPATSSPRPRLSLTGSRSSGPAGPWRPALSPACGTSPGPRSTPNWAAPSRSTGCPACTTRPSNPPATASGCAARWTTPR
jgi:ABC-type Na+ transport system ATPase subunit NatA